MSMAFFKRIISRIMGIGEVQRQSLLSFGGQITITAVGFLSTIYFARTLGSETLGAYFLFLAYFFMISMIIDGGFGGAGVKRISAREEQNAYFTSCFSLLLSWMASWWFHCRDVRFIIYYVKVL